MKINYNISPEQIDYDLPDNRIALYSAENRDDSLLLISEENRFSKSRFGEIDRFLPENSFLVLNNAKVIHARFVFHKETGARIEVFLLDPLFPASYEKVFASAETCEWKCLIGNAKKWKSGQLKANVLINGNKTELTATRSGESAVVLKWTGGVSFSEVLKHFGNIPLPPYIKREAEKRDFSDYQTVFSKVPGSVAAPTAGLHFTEKTMNGLKAKGHEFTELTLHVGAGTFLPFQGKTVQDHIMHCERILIPRSFIESVLENNNIVAVGTTSVRAMESLAAIAYRIQSNNFEYKDVFDVSQWETYEHKYINRKQICDVLLEYMKKHNLNAVNAFTSLMIVPGFRFMFTDTLITNFHQPHSTLLILVSAFMGEKWKDMYNYALENNYRFLSYGDACFIKPKLPI